MICCMISQYAVATRLSLLVGCVVEVADFKGMADSNFKRKMKDTVFLGVHSLHMGAIEKIDRIDKCKSVSLILDEGPEFAKDAYDVLQTLKSAFS